MSGDEYREIATAQLFKTLAEVGERLAADPRWEEERDDLAVEVVGMLLFGFGMMSGRIVLHMEVEDIDACVIRVLVEKLGVARKWATGLIEDANRSIFDKANHPAHYELIGVGHQYFGARQEDILENIFANFRSVRQGILANSSEGGKSRALRWQGVRFRTPPPASGRRRTGVAL